jgi:opacity protein-like surface antigen
MEYRGIRYTIRARIERDQWSVAIHPDDVESAGNVGFSVGGGIEGRFSYWLPPNWTWKLEYLYLDLGSLDTAPTPFAASIPQGVSAAIVTTGTISTDTHFTDNIVRVGLNYQFH